MAAVGALIPGWLRYGDLPPVGNRIVFERAEKSPPAFAGYTAHYMQSGTAALALALSLARQRQSHISSPNIILPAYGCPDLIAAAEFARVQPILVDIAGSDDPGYDLNRLERAIDASTIAIVAVNFLGIRERLRELRGIAARHAQIALIEDNAQWFPEPADFPLQGDFVCLSFGRGKPVSLLGGGLLLARNDIDIGLGVDLPAQANGTSLRFKAELLNFLSHRRIYALANRNPMFELGQTRFKPLANIIAMDEQRRDALPAAIAHYLAAPRTVERLWRDAIAKTSRISELAVEPERRERLLRYPVLAAGECERDVEHNRDALWQRLDRAGLGVTAMYRRALPEVRGVGGKFSLFQNYDNAKRFAARLLTLPVHAQVRERDMARALADIQQTRQITLS